jgi:hypothetical protein
VNLVSTSDADGTISRYCPSCDYDLRGLSSDRCPECGLRIEDVAVFAVPWERRQEMGRMRAFARTVRLAIFSPAKLARAAAGPVNGPAARRFGVWVAVLSAVPAILFLIATEWHLGGTGFIDLLGEDLTKWNVRESRGWEPVMIWSAGATLVPILPIGLIIAFLLEPGASRVWFGANHLSAERRERARILSTYACAPLALLAIPAVFFAALAGLNQADFADQGFWPQITLLAACLGIGTAAFILGAWWWSTLRILSRATHCGLGRCIAAAVGVPICWGTAALVGLGLWPCIAGLAWIAIDGLRR